MLLKIAWRNIWRNKRRSLIIIVSIVVGYMSLIFMDSLTAGMIRQILTNQVGTYTAHIQIHKKGYLDNPIIQNFMPELKNIEKAIGRTSGVSSYSPRVLTFGMIMSASGSAGVTIIGIEPEKESKVTTIDEHIITGKYISGEQGEIMLSSELAEKLELEVGDKLVVMASGMDGTIGTELFRVTGIFRTADKQFDRSHIYIPIESARNIIELNRGAMEIAITIENPDKLDSVSKELSSRIDDSYEVLTYREIHPLLIAQFDVFNKMMLVFYILLGIAVMFGVINTMLMAVMERINEFGILLSIGMSTRKLFSMIILEGLSLSLVGTIIGVVSGIGLSMFFAHSGINFSIFKESLTYFGAGAIIYPVLTSKGILSALSIVPVTSIIGTLYPGFKATRSEPVEALRFV